MTLLFPAWVAEVIGIHALFGAFLAGVIMPAEVSGKKLLTDKLEDVSVLLLLPILQLWQPAAHINSLNA